MTREQAIEIWEGMYFDEIITEYNYYVCDVINDEDSQLYDMDELDEVLSYCTPSEVAKKVVYGEFNPTDDHFTFDSYLNLKSVSKDDLFDFIIESVDDNHLIDVAKEYQGEEDDD